MRSRLIWAWLAGLTTALGLLVAPAASAVEPMKSPPDLVRIDASSASDKNSPKTAVATCPAGKFVLGAGGEITGGTGKVTMDKITPTATTVSVTAYENEPDPTWSVNAYAICATSIANWHIVSAETLPSVGAVKTLTATCRIAGTRVYGLGGEVGNGLGTVFMNYLVPGNTTATVQATRNQGNPTWSLKAYAICANPIGAMEIVGAGTAQNDSSPKGITATCPNGKFAHGAGAAITGVAGAQALVALDDLRPNVGVTNVTATGYENADTQWRIAAYAICMP